MKRIRTGIVLAILAVFVLSATPVYADTPDPDSTPTIEQVDIYRNSIETGDFLVIIFANILYGTLPDTPESETFIWRLMDIDGVTELGSTLGYDFNDDGYGFNVYSMYFSAATAVTLGLVWETAYSLRLIGNPLAFVSPPVFNFPVVSTDYSSETVQVDVQTEIAARVIELGRALDIRWDNSATDSLILENETTTIFSTIGESFFRGAIFGVQAMAPSAFSVVVRVIDIEAREWDTQYSENVTGQWSGTWVETAQEGGKALFGTDYDLLSVIVMLGLSGILLFGGMWLTGSAWAGMIDASLIGIFGARLGLFDLGFLMLIGFVCIFFISAKIWYGIIK